MSDKAGNMNSTSTQKVSFIEKTAFGMGHLVNNLMPGALGVFSFFLLTGFGMDPFLAGLLGGIPRIFDAVIDPIIGYISDNTVSKYGRRRPYIFIGAIFSGLLFILLWQLDENNSQMFNFWYFLLISLIYITGNAMFATPLIGLSYEMSTDYNERTKLMAYAQFTGQIAWMIVPWFWVIIANPDIFPTQVQGVRTLSYFVGGICIVLGVLPAIFCKEVDQSAITDRAELSISNIAENFKGLIKSIVQIFKNKAFVKLCGATFLVFNGFQMVASFSFFIIVFYLFNGDYKAAGNWPAWFSTVSAIFTALLVIPIVTFLSNKYGKKNAFLIATAISVIGYILKWWGFNPSNPYLMFFPLPFMVFGIGSLFLLMMSMTADVCDLDELENGMPRKESTFGAIYWWMVKLGQGLALVAGGYILKVVGFDQNAATQSLETMNNLRLADIIVPAVTALLAIYVMKDYSLSEEKIIEIKRELENRRGQL